MTGSVHNKADKLYVVLSYKDKSGKTRNKWVRTGLDAHNNSRKAKAMIPDLIQKYKGLEQLTVDSATLFSDYAREWLAVKSISVEQSTYERYHNQVKKQLIPYFGNMSLCDITPRDVSVFYSQKAIGGRADKRKGALSHKTMKSIASILRSVLRQAVIEGLIMRNPADGVPLATKDVTEHEYVFLSKDEANALLKAFEGDALHEIVFVTLYYGLRKSEALGLKWSAIDFENNTFSIEHTVVKSMTIQAKDKTKTQTSAASFELIPAVKEVLLNLRDKQAEYRRLFGNTYHESDYVFVREDGQPFRPDSLTRSFQRVLTAHNLKPMRFHDLRHSTASMLYDLGWDIKAIQTWLRHADIETTGNIYTHISNERKRILSTELNDFISF
ncbi:MAG: site-specific integrase [Oscillospiraceae bacterium]|nr:site-specific integrase [Oscillospiraceae bacterium]